MDRSALAAFELGAGAAGGFLDPVAFSKHVEASFPQVAKTVFQHVALCEAGVIIAAPGHRAVNKDRSKIDSRPTEEWRVAYLAIAGEGQIPLAIRGFQENS